MRVCGVICEYDPFHNGHAYHLRTLRALIGCDYIVCAMSGHFTQRGSAALVSKWARAEMALRGGADAVFELPAVFAVRDAERFARGGVALLQALGVVTHLGFGSETGDLEALRALSGPVIPLGAVRDGLAKGKTLARARGEAIGMAAGSPNDALAIEYLRAIRLLAPDIMPVAIRREGSGYPDETLGDMASATAIRMAVRRGDDISGALPAPANALLSRLLDAGHYQVENGLDMPLLALLRTMPIESLAQVADVGEGLENRLKRAAEAATSRDALLRDVKCKRYTRARLSRILTQAMIGITKQLTAAHPFPTYARLLGFRQGASPLMKEIRLRATVPIVTRAAKYRSAEDAAFTVDLRAGDLWSLGIANPDGRYGSRDVTEKVVIVE